MLAANPSDGQPHKSTLLRLMEGLLQGTAVLGGMGLLVMILFWTLDLPVSWEESENEEMIPAPIPKEPVYDVMLNEHIHKMLVRTRESLSLRDSRTGGLIREFPQFSWWEITCVSWLPRTHQFLVGDRKGRILIMDSRYSQPPLFSAKAHEREIRSVAVSDNGAIAATASEDRICLWNLDQRQIITQIPAQTIRPNVLQFSPDQTRLVAGCDDGSLKMFGMDELRLEFQTQPHSTVVTAIAFIENGRKILSGEIDGPVCLWDVATGEVDWELSGFVQILNLAVSPDGRLLAFSDWHRGIQVYSLETFKKINTLKGHTRPASSLEFSTREPWLYSSSYDGTVRICDIESFEELAWFEGAPPFDED